MLLSPDHRKLPHLSEYARPYTRVTGVVGWRAGFMLATGAHRRPTQFERHEDHQEGCKPAAHGAAAWRQLDRLGAGLRPWPLQTVFSIGASHSW